MFQLVPVIAHRGASAYAPENTLAAFEKARELRCRLIEFDVMLSADGQAFIFHDDTLNRTTNVRGEFTVSTAEYLKSLDAGSWFSRRFRGEKIPTLAETLKWLVAFEIQANIEIKPCPGQMEATVIAVLSELNKHWPEAVSLPLISSFDKDALRLCRSLSPEMPLGLLLHTWEENWLNIARELDCFSIHLNRRILTAARVASIKQHGYKVCAYTVNWKFQANRLLKWGVDSIFSNYPDLLS